MSGQKISSELRRTIRISTLHGAFAQICASLSAPGSIFITKFGLVLGATPLQFGLMSAVGAITQIFQPFSILLTRNAVSRKRVIIKLGLIGSFIGLTYGFIPFLVGDRAAIWVFLGLLFASAVLGSIAINIWTAWISKMVPHRVRGRFFSVRLQYAMLAGTLTGYLFTLFIDLFDPQPQSVAQHILSLLRSPALLKPSNIRYGLALIFVAGALLSIVNLLILKRQPERLKPREHFKFGSEYLTPFRDKNFRFLLFFIMWWMLVVGIGAPFWGVFALKKLNISMFQWQIYATLFTVASFLALRFWGRFVDRFGNKNLMRLGILLGGMNPLMWLFVSPGNYWLLFFEACTAGIMWSGVNICMANFVLALAPKGKEQIYSAWFNVFSGLGITTTMVLSGVLYPSPLSILGKVMEPEQVLFGITGILRLTAEIPLSFIDEPRAKPFPIVINFFFQSTKVRIARVFNTLLLRNSEANQD